MKRTRKTQRPMDYRRILIIKIRALGDTLLATPTCASLRQAFPQATITALVSPAAVDMLADNPDVDRIWCFDKHMGPITYLRFLLQLRQARFDLVVALHASFRTALLAWLSGCAQRVVHNHSGRNYFGTIPITARKEAKSSIERDLDAVRALGITPGASSLTLRLTTAAEQEMQVFLKHRHLDSSRPFMLLAPGAGTARKRWPAASVIRFVQLARHESPVPWVLLAGPQEKILTAEVQQVLGDHLAVFQGSLKAAAALIKQAAGMVTADSGPKHMACALGTPTLTLWTDEPLAEWHPYDRQQHEVIISPSGVVADLDPTKVLEKAKDHFKGLGL